MYYIHFYECINKKIYHIFNKNKDINRIKYIVKPIVYCFITLISNKLK